VAYIVVTSNNSLGEREENHGERQREQPVHEQFATFQIGTLYANSRTRDTTFGSRRFLLSSLRSMSSETPSMRSRHRKRQLSSASLCSVCGGIRQNNDKLYEQIGLRDNSEESKGEAQRKKSMQKNYPLSHSDLRLHTRAFEFRGLSLCVEVPCKCNMLHTNKRSS
jgi:hypothetical protein